jgi:glycosyltransferase involved in cell wall biosynthesis
MRLTVLSVSYPLAKVSPRTAGGAEQVLATIDKSLVSEGHRSIVLAPEGSRCHGLVIPVQVPSGLLDQTARQESRRFFKSQLDRALVSYSPDVVHMHGVDFFEYLPDSDVPIVVSLHLPLASYDRHALVPGGHNITRVCVSEFQARTAERTFAIDCVIPNGVDLNELGPTEKPGDYLLAMGRICPEKGFHLALEAAQRAGEKLILAAALFEYPEHRSYFDSRIAPRLEQWTRLIGPVGGQRKRHLLAGAKCLLIPSLVEETSSLIAMEALACGTPVIAWRSGALPEVVTDGRTGFLVSSIEEMGDAIAHVDHIDRRECRTKAERSFDARKMVSRYVDVYRRVATGADMREMLAA